MPCPGCTRPYIGCGGNLNSNVVFIGQSPGANDRPGHPFSGYASRDLDYYLLPRVARLDREDTLFTNVVSCKAVQENMDPELGLQCSRHNLPDQLRDASVIVVMGAYSCKTLGITDLEKHHGIPVPMDLPQYNWSGIVIPVIHPAQASHDAYVLGELTEDFQVIKEVLNGSYKPCNPLLSPRIMEYHTGSLPDLYGTAIAIDTETLPGDIPYLISFSYSFDSGFVCRVSDPDILVYLNHYFNSHRGPIVMHNALYDLSILSRCGIDIPFSRVTDTMILAYNQGYGSRASDDSESNYGRGRQSLKYLAWRLLRFPMLEYDELVNPHYIEAQLQWTIDALMLDWPDICTNPNTFTKSGKPRKPQYKINPVKRHLQKLLDVKNPYDSYSKWNNDILSQLSVVHRPFPEKSLTLAPWDAVLAYSGQDAVATFALYEALKSRPRIRTIL